MLCWFYSCVRPSQVPLRNLARHDVLAAGGAIVVLNTL